MPNNEKKSNLEIHFFYVTLILTAMIILLATAKWTEIPKFTDYLGAAATITSLVLGLLAIIYAYISNDSLSQATGVVSEAANEAQNATTKISSLLDTVEKIGIDTALNKQQLSGVIDELKSQMCVLANTTEALDGHSKAISTILPDIPKELDRIGKRLDDFAQLNSPSRSAQVALDDQQRSAVIGLVLEEASGSGLLLLYSVWFAKSKNLRFPLRKFSTSFSSADYMLGYFIAIKSLGLIQAKPIKDRQNGYQIESCPDEFESARELFLAKAEKIKHEGIKKDWIEAIADAEKEILASRADKNQPSGKDNS